MKVTNSSVVALFNEIVGFNSEHLAVKGLMNEMISLKTKYKLKNLLSELTKYRETLIEVYLDWVEKNDGKDFNSFVVENSDLMSSEVEVRDPFISIEDLDFKSEYPYDYFISIFIDKK